MIEKQHVLDPLLGAKISSVSFNYGPSIGLCFDGPLLTLMNTPTLVRECVTYSVNHNDYFKTLCGFPGAFVIGVDDSDLKTLVLTLDNSFKITIDLSEESYDGPEIMTFTDKTNYVVW